MPSTMHDLADEDPAPAGVGGEQPADQRAHGHGDGARRGHEPVGPRALRRPKFVATSATTAGMISAAPSPSRTDQPMMRTGSDLASAVMTEPQP